MKFKGNILSALKKAVSFVPFFALIFVLLFAGSLKVTSGERDGVDVFSAPVQKFKEQTGSVITPSTKVVPDTPKLPIDKEILPSAATTQEPPMQSASLPVGNTSSFVLCFDSNTGENVEMDLEYYVLGALLSEMPTSYENEALKAQAIACRTYTVYKIMSGTDHPSGADICTSYAHCQAFCPPDSVSETRYNRAKAAVDATHGEIMLYDSQPILAVFHASSDKKTRSSAEVWGGTLSYLTSVDTAECYNTGMSIKKEYVFPLSEFAERVRKKLSIDSTVDDLSLFLCAKTEYLPSGRVSSVSFGEKSMTGSEFAALFELRSTAFEMTVCDGNVSVVCGGYGHGVGMSQYGAQDMAQKGKNCYEILSHYYSGISFGRWEDAGTVAY